MIRWRVFGRSGRMRTRSKVQIAIAILIGFIVGYVVIPWLIPSSVQDDQDTIARIRKPAVELPHRTRDRAITYSKSTDTFIVGDKKMRILSGAIHYFRVVPDYWKDRLMRLKTAGLNTVETYVPWNLHEPLPGKYDFTGILDVAEFIRTAESLGLYVIVRPGPYICAEWELGGLPAWLLHDPDMKIRSQYPPYIKAVQRYFTKLFRLLTPLQYSYGGPVIAFQLENEYSQYLKRDYNTSGRNHLLFLLKMLRGLDVVEQLFTSDGQHSLEEAFLLRPSHDVLLTVNFQNDTTHALQKLKLIQPGKPLMVMEFWTGWFDHWGSPHLERDISPSELEKAVRKILKEGSSINLYMFHGGTNFGFMNGGNWGDKHATEYLPTITSYDYNAPLTEWGDVTEKYTVIRNLLMELVPESLPSTPLLPVPPNHPKKAYGEIKVPLYIKLVNTLQYIPNPYVTDDPIPMEYLPINEGSGQGYGYVLYRTLIPEDSHAVTVHGLKDYGVALLGTKPVTRLGSFQRHNFVLPKPDDVGTGQVILDILAENAGRVNYGHPLEVRKGINGKVDVDGVEHKQWKIYSFEFKRNYLESIESGGMWLRTPAPSDAGPSLYKASLFIEDQPKDTFVDMTGWGKGILFINGANLGRYWSVGPQKTLYVPAPILKRGVNRVMIFELHQPKNPQTLVFTDTPILNVTAHHVS